MAASKDLNQWLARLDTLVDRIEGLLPAPPAPPDWRASVAFRWKVQNGRSMLLPVARPHRIRLADLRGIDRQKTLIADNTRQFVEGRPANNVLLTGARGTGKSSLVKAVLNRHSRQGLRLIEVDKQDLMFLTDIVDMVAERPERFIIFCDDLSFDATEVAYKALKSVLDGSISASSDNVLIYATSNRRHLMPEFMQENLDYRHQDEEIHASETTEEKISLSERFGLWVSFYAFDQDDYLEIVAHWLAEFDCRPSDESRADALRWALTRGSRSGRVAWQFARDWAGRHGVGKSVVKRKVTQGRGARRARQR